MHIFPQLRKMEQKYRDELVVIGVHSAKFTAEQDTANLRNAVLRYEIEHPVVNDRDFIVWQEYSARAWPTLMFIDPEGKVIGKHEGELPLESLDQLLDKLVKEFDADGLIDRRPFPLKLEREREWERPLSFPGKLLADAASRRLFIADSNHNRIVVTSLEGEIQDIIGSGERGLADGSFDRAAFNDPQGLDVSGSSLFVADTKNHSIRKVDLEKKTVETVAGTGSQARMFHGGGQGPDTDLSSPWDVTVHGDTVYIAMAGFHQLWRLHVPSGEVRPHAGSGRERITDGALEMAELAQPSGTATDGTKLYFTDSETSAIRAADLDPSGGVSTIVGLHLFTFGDVDGTGDDVRLQHPLGIDMHDGVLFITDTYNNKIKRIYPATRGAINFVGTGDSGHEDGPGNTARFHEPGDLSVAAGTLYVADTNNHAVRTVDLETQEVATLELKGL